MNSAKFLVSTLIAAAAMTATAYAETAPEYGTLSWTTAPTTGGNFYGANYGLTFNFTDSLIKSLDADKTYVLAAYWGENNNDPDANALLLNYSSEAGKWTIQLGRGELVSGGYGSAINENTRFELYDVDYVTFDTSIVAGTEYTLAVTGGNQAMTPTLGWGSESEALNSYKGNMNGGNAGTTMSYSLLTFYNLWDGGESGNWSDNTWNTGLANNQSFSAGIDTKFNSSAVMTAVENVSMKSLTIADSSELTLAGEGIVSVSNAALVLGEGATVRLGEEVTLRLGEKQNGTLSNIVGSGTVIWGNTNKNSGHGTTINLTDDFTGTLELSGCISTAQGALDLGGDNKDRF